MTQCEYFDGMSNSRCCYHAGHSGDHYCSNLDETDRIRWKLAADERDRLIAENDSLRAEVERLRDDNARLLVAKLPTSEDYDRIVKQLAAARAEIERLKRDVELNHILGEGTWVPEEALTIAERNLAATRAALKKAIGIAEQLVRHHGDYFNCRYRLSELSTVARDD